MYLISLKNVSYSLPRGSISAAMVLCWNVIWNEDSALDALATLGFIAGMELVNAISKSRNPNYATRTVVKGKFAVL